MTLEPRTNASPGARRWQWATSDARAAARVGVSAGSRHPPAATSPFEPHACQLARSFQRRQPSPAACRSEQRGSCCDRVARRACASPARLRWRRGISRGCQRRLQLGMRRGLRPGRSAATMSAPDVTNAPRGSSLYPPAAASRTACGARNWPSVCAARGLRSAAPQLDGGLRLHDALFVVTRQSLCSGRIRR